MPIFLDIEIRPRNHQKTFHEETSKSIHDKDRIPMTAPDVIFLILIGLFPAAILWAGCSDVNDGWRPFE